MKSFGEHNLKRLGLILRLNLKQNHAKLIVLGTPGLGVPGVGVRTVCIPLRASPHRGDAVRIVETIPCVCAVRRHGRGAQVLVRQAGRVGGGEVADDAGVAPGRGPSPGAP